MLITIRNGNLYATIDDVAFAVKQARGRLKGWEALTGEITVPTKQKKHFSEVTGAELKALLDEAGYVYEKNCKDKRKLYNIYLKT